MIPGSQARLDYQHESLLNHQNTLHTLNLIKAERKAKNSTQELEKISFEILNELQTVYKEMNSFYKLSIVKKDYKFFKIIIDKIIEEVSVDETNQEEIDNLKTISRLFKEKLSVSTPDSPKMEMPLVGDERRLHNVENEAPQHLPKLPERKIERPLTPAIISSTFRSMIDDPDFNLEQLQKRNDLSKISSDLKALYSEKWKSLSFPWNWLCSLLSYVGVNDLGQLRTLFDRVDEAQSKRIDNFNKLCPDVIQPILILQQMCSQGVDRLADVIDLAVTHGVDNKKVKVLAENISAQEISNALMLKIASDPIYLDSLIEVLRRAPPDALTGITHVIARNQTLENIKILIPYLSLNSLNEKLDGETPLDILIKRGKEKIISAIFDCFDKLADQLDLALSHGMDERVRVLAENIDSQEISNALMLKIASNPIYVDSLIELLRKAPREVLTGITLVIVRTQNPENIKKLIPYVSPNNFYKNCDDETLFHILLKHGETDVIIAMLERAGNLNAQNLPKTTILECALEKRNSSVIAALLNLEDIEWTKKQRQAVIQYAIKTREAIPFIIKFCSDELQFQNEEGDTLLHVAARYPNSPLLDNLLDVAFPLILKAKNEEGRSVLEIGLIHQNIRVIQKMIEKIGLGLIRNLFPLHILAKHRTSEMLLELLPLFPQEFLEDKNGEGEIPLHIAITSNKNNKVIEKILERMDGNVWNAANREGKTMIEFALEKKNIAIIKAILSLKKLELTQEEQKAVINFALNVFTGDITLAEQANNMHHILVSLDDILMCPVFHYDQTDGGVKERITISEGVWQKIYSDVKRYALQPLIRKPASIQKQYANFLCVINNFTCDNNGNSLLYHLMKEAETNSKLMNYVAIFLRAGADAYADESIIPWIMKSKDRQDKFLPCLRHLRTSFEETFGMDPEFELAEAIANNDIESVRRILKPGKHELKNPLFLAMQSDELEIINVILQAGYDPNVVDENDYPPIMIAAIKGDQEAFNVLASAKGLNEDDKEMASVLIKGWKPILDNLEKLIDGLSSNINEALLSKELGRILELSYQLELMIKYAQDIETKKMDIEKAKDLIMRTPGRCLDAYLDNFGKVKLEKNVEEKLWSCLHEEKSLIPRIKSAISNGNHKLLELLCTIGADLKIIVEQGNSVLQWLLLGLGNKLSESSNLKDLGLILYRDYIPCIEMLIKAGVKLNAYNNKTVTIAQTIVELGKKCKEIQSKTRVNLTPVLIELIFAPVMKDVQWDYKPVLYANNTNPELAEAIARVIHLQSNK